MLCIASVQEVEDPTFRFVCLKRDSISLQPKGSLAQTPTQLEGTLLPRALIYFQKVPGEHGIERSLFGLEDVLNSLHRFHTPTCVYPLPASERCLSYVVPFTECIHLQDGSY